MIRLGEKSSFHDYQKVPLHFKREIFENYVNDQQFIEVPNLLAIVYL